MASTPLFTAAIICFNRRTMVRAAIESALNQKSQDYELVIVDDASTDGTADVLTEFADRATVIVREQNGGEMAARNTAIGAARGEYICFLDSDDLWFPWTLATFANAIGRHRQPTMVGGQPFNFEDEAELSGVGESEYRESIGDCYFESAHYIGAASAAIRRDAIEEAGGFVDLRYNCLDSDLMLRIGDRPGFVKIQSPPTFAFRHHESIMGNTAMAYGGAKFLIDSELGGKYPGGEALRDERLKHLTIRARNISLQCARSGQMRQAFELYRKTLRWNLRLRRWGYLLAAPLIFLYPPLGSLRYYYAKFKHARKES